MKKSTWTIFFGLGLVFLSSILYFVHYLLFEDVHHIFIYFMGDIAFIPIEVLVVSLIIHKALERKEKLHVLGKLNMLIGIFFSEVGVELLNLLLKSDGQKKNICRICYDITQWEDCDFKSKINAIQAHDYNIKMEKIDIEELANLLKSKRDFLLRLLQNPSLLEHDAFSEVLRAVFHLEDELHHYISYENLPKDSIDHLKVDIERVYPLIINEWLEHMKYLKKNYPYLYSINERYNPFDSFES